MSIKLMTHVWDTAPASGSDLVVLLAFADYGDDNGENIFPSMPTVAKKARLSVDQARRVVHGLIEDGIVELVEQGGWNGKRNRPNEYRIIIDGGTRVDASTRPRVDASTVPAPTRADPLIEPLLLTVNKKREIVPDGTPPPNESIVKEKKRRRQKAEADSPPSSGDPPSPKEPTDWQKFVGAMCWICFGHDKVSDLTSAQRGALLAEAKKINEAGYSIEDLKKWYLDTWKQGWKWKKDESRPTPAEVRSSIPVLRSNAPQGFDGKGGGDGQAASGTGFSPEEIERIRELRREGKREEVGEYVRAINARSGANL